MRARLAVVPMSQEARGLDAGPRLVERLVGAGDHRTAAVVARIAAEEARGGVAWGCMVVHGVAGVVLLVACWQPRLAKSHSITISCSGYL